MFKKSCFNYYCQSNVKKLKSFNSDNLAQCALEIHMNYGIRSIVIQIANQKTYQSAIKPKLLTIDSYLSHGHIAHDDYN